MQPVRGSCLFIDFVKCQLHSIFVLGIRLVGDICSAELTGCDDGSCSLMFKPGPIKPASQHVADPGTAGSTTLLLQISLPILLFSPPSDTSTKLILRGGTNATHAPQIDYTVNVFLPFLQRNFGVSVPLTIQKRGYYPRGGGEIHVDASSLHNPIPAITLTDRGKVIKVSGRSYVAGLPQHLADTMEKAAAQALRKYGLSRELVHIDVVREKPGHAVGSGSGIVLWAETDTGCILGGSALGFKNKDFSEIGTEAADELIRNLEYQGCVDEYTQARMLSLSQSYAR